MRLRFRHWRPLVVSFTPTEAGTRSSVPNLSIGFSVTRFAHETAPEIHFQEMGTLLPVYDKKWTFSKCTWFHEQKMHLKMHLSSGHGRPGPAGPGRPGPGPARLPAGARRQNSLSWGSQNAQNYFLLCCSPVKSQQIDILSPCFLNF